MSLRLIVGENFRWKTFEETLHERKRIILYMESLNGRASRNIVRLATFGANVTVKILFQNIAIAALRCWPSKIPFLMYRADGRAQYKLDCIGIERYSVHCKQISCAHKYWIVWIEDLFIRVIHFSTVSVFFRFFFGRKLVFSIKSIFWPYRPLSASETQETRSK